MKNQPLLSIRNYGVSFTRYEGGLKSRDLQVISSLDIDVHEGEIVAIVGSSGSGKSLLADGIFGILPYNAVLSGEIYYDGKLLTQQDKEALRGREMSLIPQSVNYLDPLKKVGKQVELSVRDKDKKKRRKVVEDLFARYNLSSEVYDYYPFQLSGGMARRVLLTTALAAGSRLIVADEPTPGLDEAALKEVLKDFRVLVDNGCSILMITHDINAAVTIADRVAIFYAGMTLEIASRSDFRGDGQALRHPYSKALHAAIPANGFRATPGFQPYSDNLPEGCVFCDRCDRKTERCLKERPEFRELRGGKVRCHHAT